MNSCKNLTRLALTVLLLTRGVGAAEYTIDAAHSKALFKVKHLGISTVTGHFGKFSGSYDFDPKTGAGGKVTATIDAASVNTDNEKRDTHLKSPDFLDAQKYPTITFVSKEIKNAGEGKYKLTGDLTMHGVTKTIVLDTEFGGVASMGGSERSAFTATGVINRKDFDVAYSKTMDNGGLVVGNEVKITLEIEGVRKAAK